MTTLPRTERAAAAILGPGEVIQNELAALLGVAPHHVGRWTSSGLIEASRRPQAGGRGRPYKVIAPAEVERVRSLHALSRRCRVPLGYLLKLYGTGLLSVPDEKESAA